MGLAVRRGKRGLRNSSGAVRKGWGEGERERELRGDEGSECQLKKTTHRRRGAGYH